MGRVMHLGFARGNLCNIDKSKSALEYKTLWDFNIQMDYAVQTWRRYEFIMNKEIDYNGFRNFSRQVEKICKTVYVLSDKTENKKR